MKKRRQGILLATLLVVVSAAVLHTTLRTSERAHFPAPTDGEPGERGPDFKRHRREWIESLHRHAPDSDWRAQDAQWRTRRMQRVQPQRQAMLAAGASADSLRRLALAPIQGSWHERGSSNQAGRVTAALYEADNERLTLLSQGGHVWRAQRSALAWSSPNDSASFQTTGFLDRLGGSGERLLVASDTPNGVYFSDDGGSSFEVAPGSVTNAWMQSGLAVRAAGAADVYLTQMAYDASLSRWRTRMLASSDRGGSFASLGFIGEDKRAALFSPRYDSSEVFVLVDASLKRIVSGTQALVEVGTVPVSPPVAAGDRVHLAGGVQTGALFLYAFYSRGGADRTDVYRSLDGGVSWQARGSVPENTFGPNSATSSTRDAARVYLGGVNAYRSHDGGANWTLVNHWGAYYGDPLNKLHADIPSIDVWLDRDQRERVLVSTDGGLYESTDDLLTVKNLSMDGLHISQYYSSYTRRTGPRIVLAGAQDQGYQKALTPGGGIDTFNQVISGDYGHLSSSDGGANLWLVYPGFAMIDTATGSASQSGLRVWNFQDEGMRDSMWMPPLVADPANPRRALLAGGRLLGSGHHVVNLTWSGSAFSANQEAFDFGSAVTALAYSPQVAGKRYAVGSDRKFFRDSGAGWAQTASNLPDHHYFYGQKILADRRLSDTVYVAGAGYSNPPVFVSSDDGASFAPMSDGLPNTLVLDLAMSADGAHLFAATEVGPFYFDRAHNQWVDISGLGAPDQVYWAVDYVDEEGGGVARFATHGRGIWDFRPSDDVVFRNGFDS